MVPEIKKDSMQISSLAAQSHCDVLVEGDTIVPDTKPDILRVLQVDGRAQISKKDIQNGRVVFTGNADFVILYRPDSETVTVKSLTVHLPFNHIEEIENLSPEMMCQSSCDVSHVEFDLINSRKLAVKAVVTVDFKAYQTQMLPLVTAMEGEGIQTRCKQLNAYAITACDETDFSVTDTLEVPSSKPSILEILNMHAQLKSKDMKLVSNKIVTKGTISICTLYLADDDSCAPQYMEHEVPFTEVLDVDGVTEDGVCDFDYKIKDIAYELSQDVEGECRIIGVEIVITASTKAAVSISADIIDDCYCPQNCLNLQRQPYKVDEIANNFNNAITLRESFTLPVDHPPIMQIYNIEARPCVENMANNGGTLTISGSLDVSILYLSDDSEASVFSYTKQIPFSQAVDCPQGGSITCDFTADVDHCDYTIVNSAELDVRAILSTKTTVYRQSTMELIDSCQEEPYENNEQSSIVIYFVQDGDSLWNVAKRYRTTIDNILYANAIDEGVEMKKGMQLIIPR